MKNEEIIEKLLKVQKMLSTSRISGQHAYLDLMNAVSIADEYCCEACEPLGLDFEEEVRHWSNKAYVDIEHGRYRKAKRNAQSNVGVFLDLMRRL